MDSILNFVSIPSTLTIKKEVENDIASDQYQLSGNNNGDSEIVKWMSDLRKRTPTNEFSTNENIILPEELDPCCDSLTSDPLNDPLEDPLGNAGKLVDKVPLSFNFKARNSILNESKIGAEEKINKNSPNANDRKEFSSFNNEPPITPPKVIPKKILKCSHCDFSSNWPSQLKRHLLNHSPEKCKIFRCENCNYTTYKASAMKLHNFKYMKSGNCKRGGRLSQEGLFSDETLSIKKEIEDEDAVSQLDCHNSFSSRQIVNDSESFGEMLNVKCKEEKSMGFDENVECGSNSFVLKCSYCSVETNSQSKMDEHMLKHLSAGESSQVYCSGEDLRKKVCSSNKQANKIDNRYILSEVERNRRDIPTDGLNSPFTESLEFFKCSFCKFRTKFKNTLDKHIKSHSNITVKKNIFESDRKRKAFETSCDIKLSNIKKEDDLTSNEGSENMEGPSTATSGNDSMYLSLMNQNFVNDETGSSASDFDFNGFEDNERDQSNNHHGVVNDANGEEELGIQSENEFRGRNYESLSLSENVDVSYSTNNFINIKQKKNKRNIFSNNFYESKILNKSHLMEKDLILKKEKLYKCKKCTFKTKQKYLMKSHIKECSSFSSKIYKCNTCPFQTTYLLIFKKHSLIHVSGTNNIQKNLISEKHSLDSNSEATNINIPKVSSETLSTKASAKASHKSRYTISKEIMIKTPERYKGRKMFENDDIKSTSIPTLVNHENSSSKFKESSPDRNNSEFYEIESNCVSSSSLKKSDSKFSLRKFNCSHCDYSSSSSKLFKKHIMIHSKIKRFSCELCDYVTNIKKSIKNHYLRFHRSKLQQKCIDSNGNIQFDKLISQLCIPASINFIKLGNENISNTSKKEPNVNNNNRRETSIACESSLDDIKIKKEGGVNESENFTYSPQNELENYSCNAENQPDSLLHSTNKDRRCDIEMYEKESVRDKEDDTKYVSMKISLKISNKNESNQHISNEKQSDDNATPLHNLNVCKEQQSLSNPAKTPESSNKNIIPKQHPMIFCCKICPFTSGYKENLKRHFYAKHSDVKMYKCKSCHFSADRKFILEGHISECHFGSNITDSFKDHFDSKGNELFENHLEIKKEKYISEYNDDIGNVGNIAEVNENNKEIYVAKTEKSNIKIMTPTINEHKTNVFNSKDFTQGMKPIVDIIFKCLVCDFHSKWTRSVRRHFIKKHPHIETEMQCNGLPKVYTKIGDLEEPSSSQTDDIIELNNTFNHGYIHLLNKSFDNTIDNHSGEDSFIVDPNTSQSNSHINRKEKTKKSPQQQLNYNKDDKIYIKKEISENICCKDLNPTQKFDDSVNKCINSSIVQSIKKRNRLGVRKYNSTNSYSKSINFVDTSIVKKEVIDNDDEIQEIPINDDSFYEHNKFHQIEKVIDKKLTSNCLDDEVEEALVKGNENSKLKKKESGSLEDLENYKRILEETENVTEFSNVNEPSGNLKNNELLETSNDCDKSLSSISSEISKIKKCSQCEFKCYSHKIMLHHLKVHKKKPQVKGHLKKQGSSTIIGKRLLKCSLCNFKSRLQKQLVRHLISHSEVSDMEKIIHCSQCGFETLNLKEYKLHKKYHKISATNIKDDLDMPNKELSPKKQIRKPVKKFLTDDNESRKKKIFRCLDCDYVTVWKNSMKIHIQDENHHSFIYECRKCSFIADKKSKFKEHQLIHMKRPTVYNCLTCDFKTTWKVALKKHASLLNHKALPHSCSICSFKGNSLEELKNHRHCKRYKPVENKCSNSNIIRVKDLANEEQSYTKLASKRQSKKKRITSQKQILRKRTSIKKEPKNPKDKTSTKMQIEQLRKSSENNQSCSKTRTARPKSKNKTLKKFDCSHCNFQTTRLNRLTTHNVNNHMQNGLSCKYCFYKTYSQTVLNRHMSNYHF